MSQIYVYLIDQLHLAINTTPATPIPSTLKTLGDLANVAEGEVDLFVATGYHKERIGKYQNVAAWFSYAAFCRRNGRGDVANELFQQVLTWGDSWECMLAIGCVSSETEQFDKARVFLHGCRDKFPEIELCRTILELFYDLMGEQEESENFVGGSDNRYLAAAEYLVSIHCGQLTERAITSELLQPSPSKIHAYFILSTLEQQRGNFEQAIEYLQSAISIKQDDPDIWVGLGQLYYRQGNYPQAQSAFETVLTLVTPATDMSIVHIRLSAIYIQQAFNSKELSEKQKFAKQAKTMSLYACENSPSSSSWLGVGKACIVLEEYDQASDALSEANFLNNRDATVWGQLAILSLIRGENYEASQCIAQAFRLSIRDYQVLRRLGGLMQKVDVSVSIECLRMALELSSEAYEESKKRQENSLILKELKKRQERRQYEIEHMIFTRSEIEVEAEKVLVVEGDASLLEFIEGVKSEMTNALKK